MRELVLLLSLVLCGAFVVPAAKAEIYKYVDENGRLVFVGDESKIPPRYRSQTTPIREKTDDLDPAELQAYQQQQAEARTERQLRQRARLEAAAEARRRDHRTSVMIRGNRILVPVEVAERNRVAHLVMLLDTGASRTVIHRNAVGHLPLRAGEKVQAVVAGGGALPSERSAVRYLEVGPHRITDMEVMLIDPVRTDLPFDGLLGNDFLRSHPYEIDYDKEILTWKGTE